MPQEAGNNGNELHRSGDDDEANWDRIKIPYSITEIMIYIVVEKSI
jgi:hypothetical protein